MKQHNYKKGDKVRIIGNKCRVLSTAFHIFKNGEIVTVQHVNRDGDLFCRRDRDGKVNFVYPEHVELVTEEKPVFTRDDIEAGYLLEVKRESNGETFYMTVVPARYNDLDGLGCCCPGQHWWQLSEWDKDTLDLQGPINTYTILRVYGHTSNMRMLDNTTEDRELLWERKEEPKVVEMTVAEISEKLGFEVKIVKED